MTRPLVVLSRVLPFHGIGGMEAVAWDLARSLAADGVPVTALTTRIPGRPERFVADGVSVAACAAARPARYSRAWWRSTRAYFERERPAAQVAVLSVSAAAYGVLGKRRAYGLDPVVLQAHGTALGELVSKLRTGRPIAALQALRNAAWLARDLAAYRRFDAVVAVGDAGAAGLRRAPLSWCFDAAAVQVIQNGIDTARFAPNRAARDAARAQLGCGAGDTVLVSTSRLHAQKGVDHAVRGFARLVARRPASRLLVVGGGPERGRLEGLAGRLGVANRVRFAGPVPREELVDYLRAADALVLTTLRQEGLPLVALEALAVGIPAFVSRHLRSVLAISPAVHGVDPTNAEGLAAAIDRVVGPAPRGSGLLPEEYTLGYATARYRRVLGV